MATLVLLPGMDGTGTLFASFVTALGGEFKIKVVTYPTDEPLTYAELESIARDAIPAEGPLILLGESFSGPIAVSLAATHASRVKGLVLCCTFIRNPRPIFSAFKSLAGVVPVGHIPLSFIGHFLLGRFDTPSLRLAIKQALAPVTPSTLRARLLAVISVDVSAKLASIKPPVLYLRGTQDRVVPLDAYALVSQIRPLTKLISLDAPHCLLQTMPSEAAHIVGAFVRDLANADPSPL